MFTTCQQLQICSLCGKQFTFASLVQHEKRCVTNWEREQAELPASMKAKHRPALASEQMRKAQAIVEKDMQRFLLILSDSVTSFLAAILCSLTCALHCALLLTDAVIRSCANLEMLTSEFLGSFLLPNTTAALRVKALRRQQPNQKPSEQLHWRPYWTLRTKTRGSRAKRR